MHRMRKGRNYEFFFNGEQTWVDKRKRIKFVGTGDSAETLLEDDLKNQPDEVPSKPVVTPSSSVTVRGSEPHTATAEIGLPDDNSPDYSVAIEQEAGTSTRAVLDDSLLVQRRSSRVVSRPIGSLVIDESISYSARALLPTEPAYPLRTLRERRLFQHFINHLASWFDVGDSKRHFGKIATCMAMSSPLLMNVILAIGALHQSRISGQKDHYEAMDYHDKALGMIVPMLSSSEGANEDCILMSTTILHLYDGLETGDDLPRHLKGTSTILPTQALSTPHPLRLAVFWLHLRQEIYNAYLYQRSVDTDLSTYTFDPDTPDAWFHHTLYIAAQVSKWNHVSYRDLRNLVKDWETNHPASFNPLYYRARDPLQGRYFPEIGYVCDEHVAAAHFIYLPKLLLATHDPKIPRLGPKRRAAEAAMQDTALGYVRTLVGIAQCNDWVPARFTAILMVMMCDSWFTDRGEQEAILEFMRETEKYSGWEGGSRERDLRREWGWEEDGEAVE